MSERLYDRCYKERRLPKSYLAFLLGLLLIALLSGCQSLAPLPTQNDASALNPELDWFVFSNGAVMSLNMPRHDWRLNRAPELKLDELQEFGEIFMLRSDRPRTFKSQPHLFEMAMNVLSTDSDGYAGYLVQRASSNEKRLFNQGGLSWECDNYTQIFAGRSGRRWVCVSAMTASYTLLVYGKITPWVQLGEERLDYWEAVFFESLNTIQLSTP